MPQFLKKPIPIEAEQYTEYGKLVRGMCNSLSCFSSGNNQPHVHTAHQGQIMLLEVGDWVVLERFQRTDFPCPAPQAYPIKPDVFEATYEPVV